MLYVPLAEDLTKILEGYPDNPLITENQRRIWKVNGRRRAITHGMLGKDHPQALRLLEEDGYDGKPVGSLSRRSAESFWYYTDNHIFPSEDDLIRLGIFMHLDAYQILALVLKGKWEEFFAREICEWRANVGKNLAEILKREEEMEEALSRFNPDTGPLLWRLLSHANADLSKKEGYVEEIGQVIEPLKTLVEKAMDRMHQSGVRWLVDAGYTPETFDTLVQKMLMNKLHWVATDSPELEHFKQQAVEEVVIWSQGTPDDREEYWSLDQARQQLLLDLDDMYLRIEQVRLQNARVKSQYLKLFGKYEVDLQDLQLRCYELEQKIALKRLKPELSEEQLDAQVQDKIKDIKDRLDQLRKEADEALHIIPWPTIFGPGGTIGGNELANYIDECKKVLRQIYHKIHPDRLKNHPNYEKLTDKQKEELKERLQKALDIKKTIELGHPPEYLESRFRTLGILRSILKEVDTILRTAGLDIDPRLEMQGDTLPERLAWLRDEINLLEGQLQAAKGQLQAMLQDDDIAQKRAILANEDRHEEIQEEMKKQIDEYKEKAEELEQELKKLLAREAR